MYAATLTICVRLFWEVCERDRAGKLLKLRVDQNTLCSKVDFEGRLKKRERKAAVKRLELKAETTGGI